MEKVYSFKELSEIFPFGKSKIQKLCKAGVLPVVKVGRSYITSDELLKKWFEEHEGKEVLY